MNKSNHKVKSIFIPTPSTYMHSDMKHHDKAMMQAVILDNPSACSLPGPSRRTCLKITAW